MGFLSWNALAIEVLASMAEICNSELTSNAKSCVIRPEFIACLRVVIKSALPGGPPGILRGIVPAFFSFMFQWQCERALRIK